MKKLVFWLLGVWILVVGLVVAQDEVGQVFAQETSESITSLEELAQNTDSEKTG